MSCPSEGISVRSRSHGRLGNQEEKKIGGPMDASDFNFSIMKGRAKENMDEEIDNR